MTTSRHCCGARDDVSTCRSDDGDAIAGTIKRGGRDIAVSQYAAVRKIFTADDVLLYGRLIGDLNPIHTRGRVGHTSGQEDAPSSAVDLPGDNNLVKIRQEDGKTEAVVHGMLIGSLFSSIFGTLIPGSVYRSQNLVFRAPVFASEPVLGRVEVMDIKKLRGRGSLVTCDTTVVSYPDDEALAKTCVEGKAEVWLPGI